MAEFTPTKDQQEVLSRVLDQELSVLAVAGPGAGKSRIALELTRSFLARREMGPGNILFLSFSNATIHRLAQSAGVYFNQATRSLRFMTYHSYAADFLSRYGRFGGLPARVRIVDPLEQRLLLLRAGPLEPDEQAAMLAKIAAENGLLSFETLIPYASRILDASARLRAIVQRQYPLIIVDEFQDTSEEQWRLLQLIGQSAQVLALSDPNQIIYSSFGATPSRTEEFENWKSVERFSFSDENHRCSASRILSFASCLLSSKPFPKSNHKDELYFICLGYRNQLVEYLTGVTLDFARPEAPKATLGILVPSNRYCEELGAELRTRVRGAKLSTLPQLIGDPAAYDAVPLAVAALADYARSGDENTKQEAVLALMTLNSLWNPAFRATTRRQKEIAEQLESSLKAGKPPFAPLFAKFTADSEPDDVQKTLVAAMTQLRVFKVAAARIAAHDKYHLKKKDYGAENSINAFLEARRDDPLREEPLSSPIQILNYWKAKGREFDYVILVVDPRHENSRATIEEQRRLYYVCATRAKQCLVVVYFKNELGRVLGPVLAPVEGTGRGS